MWHQLAAPAGIHDGECTGAANSHPAHMSAAVNPPFISKGAADLGPECGGRLAAASRAACLRTPAPQCRSTPGPEHSQVLSSSMQLHHRCPGRRLMHPGNPVAADPPT